MPQYHMPDESGQTIRNLLNQRIRLSGIGPMRPAPGESFSNDLQWMSIGHIPDYSLQDAQVGDMDSLDAARMRGRQMVREYIDLSPEEARSSY